jgi:hypothetical protein
VVPLLLSQLTLCRPITRKFSPIIKRRNDGSATWRRYSVTKLVSLKHFLKVAHAPYLRLSSSISKRTKRNEKAHKRRDLNSNIFSEDVAAAVIDL